jgi:hypothetical protein
MPVLVRASVLAALVVCVSSVARAIEASEPLAPAADVAAKPAEIKGDPAPAPKPPEAPAEVPPPSFEASRIAGTPSPGGGGTPLAMLVDRPGLQLALRGLLQLAYSPYVGADALVANGDALDFPGFRMRRLQLGFEGQVRGKVAFSVWLDLAQAPLLLQASLSYGLVPEFGAEAGVMKVPFSRSALQSSADLTFSERPLTVSGLVPEYQPGVAVYGAFLDGLVAYRAGFFNGAASARAGSGPDHAAGLSAARVAVAPLGALRRGQSDVEGGPLRIELAGNVMHNAAAGYTGNTFGGDLLVQAFHAALLLEYIRDVKSPVSQPITGPGIPDQTTRTGMIAQASYVLGMFELAARGELVDDNTALEDVGDFTATTVGVHALLSDLKLALDWNHRVEKFGPALANDSVVLTLQGRL